MRIASLRVASVVPFLLAAAACSSGQGGGEDIGMSSARITQSTIISRGMEWVNAKLHYCQAAYDAVDGDSSCWAWEGSSHRCDRQSNAAWDAYRSDCSGFVTYSWGLSAVGDGGYTTGDFAPYATSFSHTIQGSDLQPGDALNKTPAGHIILFEQWVTDGQSALFMEEPGCSSSEPYAHEFTSNVSINGTEVYVDYEGANFYAIRFDSATSDGSGGGGSGSGGGSGGGSGSSSGGGSGSSSGGGGGSSPDACNQGNGFCTATLQCDNGHWTVRQDDPNACTTVQDVDAPCNVGSGYCTQALQCDNGNWVPRQDDSAACTSGPGAG